MMHSDAVIQKIVHYAFQFFFWRGDIAHKMVIVLDTRGYNPMEFFPKIGVCLERGYSPIDDFILAVGPPNVMFVCF